MIAGTGSQGSRQRYTTGTNGPETDVGAVGSILPPHGPNTSPGAIQMQIAHRT